MSKATNQQSTGTRLHRMRLLPDLLHLVAAGRKTIEVRVADVKRLAVRSGDLIELSPASGPAVPTLVRVVRTTRYPSFTALLAAEDPHQIHPLLSPAEQLEALHRLYTPDRQALGALAIEVSVAQQHQAAMARRRVRAALVTADGALLVITDLGSSG